MPARFPELEDEMADFAHDGLSDGRSPDRLDALVWALASLTQPRRPAARAAGVSAASTSPRLRGEVGPRSGPSEGA